MSFIDLRCPHCTKPLTAPVGYRVYVCDGCGTSCTPTPADVEGRAPRRLWVPPRYRARPRQPLPPGGRILLFPVWVFPLEQDPGLPREIRVPALGRRAFGRLVAAAQRMSRDPRPLELLQDPSQGCHPRPPEAELGVEEAYAVAEVVALAHRTGWPAGAEAEAWEPPLGELRLVDLPCHDGPSGLVELAQGLSLDAAAAQALQPVEARSLLRLEEPQPVS